MCKNASPEIYKILYIDDDENNTRLMKRILEASGYEVSLAPNGSMGLAQAYRFNPDLILLDIYMPDLNGHEVARRLRQMEQTKNTPILMVSASSNPQDRPLSTQAGCNGYIPKPINIDRISSQVAAFL
jgi:CheY-like chemotaxis protein